MVEVKKNNATSSDDKSILGTKYIKITLGQEIF